MIFSRCQASPTAPNYAFQYIFVPAASSDSIFLRGQRKSTRLLPLRPAVGVATAVKTSRCGRILPLFDHESFDVSHVFHLRMPT